MVHLVSPWFRTTALGLLMLIVDEPDLGKKETLVALVTLANSAQHHWRQTNRSREGGSFAGTALTGQLHTALPSAG